MILGLLLGIAFSFLLGSLSILLINTTGVVQMRLLTGAVVGTQTPSIPTVLIFILSLIATFLLVRLITRKPNPQT